MYIDFSIPIPAKLPKILQNNIETLQQYYDENNWVAFDFFWEGVEGNIKSCVLAGKISRDDAIQLMHRYGIY